MYFVILDFHAVLQTILTQGSLHWGMMWWVVRGEVLRIYITISLMAVSSKVSGSPLMKTFQGLITTSKSLVLQLWWYFWFTFQPIQANVWVNYGFSERGRKCIQQSVGQIIQTYHFPLSTYHWVWLPPWLGKHPFLIPVFFPQISTFLMISCFWAKSSINQTWNQAEEISKVSHGERIWSFTICLGYGKFKN